MQPNPFQSWVEECVCIGQNDWQFHTEFKPFIVESSINFCSDFLAGSVAFDLWEGWAARCRRSCKKVDKVQILVDVALVILCGDKAKPRKLFQGPPSFTNTTQWIRTITFLLGDDACNRFGWKNLQLKEDFTLLNIKNSKKDILSSNYVLQFIFKKF